MEEEGDEDEEFCEMLLMLGYCMLLKNKSTRVPQVVKSIRYEG